MLKDRTIIHNNEQINFTFRPNTWYDLNDIFYFNDYWREKHIFSYYNDNYGKEGINVITFYESGINPFR